MKGLILSISLLISVISYSQKIKRIVDKNDVAALQEHISTIKGFENVIVVRMHDFEHVELHPFVYAVTKGNLELVKIFVKNKLFFADFDKQLSLAFALSITQKNAEVMNYLYGLKPNINEICDFCLGQNALLISVANGNEDLFFKLKSSSDFNLISKKGNNLFHLVAEKSSAFSWVIYNELKGRKDLDINLVNKFDRTPLHYAARSGNEKLYFDMLKSGAQPVNLKSLYIDAVFGGDLKIFAHVSEWIKTPPIWQNFPEMTDSIGDTYYALETAIKYNRSAVIKIIFKEMFDEVKQVKQDDQIEILIKILNSRQLEDNQFWPLWEIIQFENKELFEFLIKNMVELNRLKIPYTAYNEFVEDDYTENAEVLFTRFEYRAAKRRFGKKYVKNLYKQLAIKF